MKFIPLSRFGIVVRLPFKGLGRFLGINRTRDVIHIYIYTRLGRGLLDVFLSFELFLPGFMGEIVYIHSLSGRQVKFVRSWAGMF